jgi:prophage regulatory protein
MEDGMQETLMRLEAVMHRTGLKRTKLYGMIGEGNFPQPMKIDGCSVWPSSEIDQWINQRVSAWRSKAA